MPASFSTYHEPFAGGAALFFEIRPERAVLSDVNPLLIDCYRAVKSEPDAVLQALARLRNYEGYYYWVRDVWKPKLRATKAARLLYLQSLSFNGLYRENLAGEFNVPYGYKKDAQVRDRGHILEVSKSLARTQLRVESFQNVLNRAKSDDFVYLDPPYTVAHNNNGFVKYNATIYSWQQQIELADVARELRSRGCHVMISNAYHHSVVKLYRRGDFKVMRIDRPSLIGSKPEYRKPTSEALIVAV